MRGKSLKKLKIAGYLYLVLSCYFTTYGFAQPMPGCSTQARFAFGGKLRVPEPTNLCDYIKDKAVAIQLGKAFFWDIQAGSDGVTACATCHFHAGSDPRVKNQLSPVAVLPNTDPLKEPPPAASSFEVGGPNYTLKPEDFPFHRKAIPDDPTSEILFDSDDVASSQGVHNRTFVGVVPGVSEEDVMTVPDPVFNVGGVNTRRVEPRHTMSVINTVFNFESFWDGRAKFFFNGVTPFGLLDENVRILERQGETPDDPVMLVKVEIDYASLASQAVAPETSPFEMSADGRQFPHVGKKMLSLMPLAKQVVHPNDSVLGPLSNDNGTLTAKGLKTTYKAMVEAAFVDKYWNSDKLFDVNQNEIGSGPPTSVDVYNLMEMNFSLFWGLAIQMYESTLISDQSAFDSFRAGDQTALTAEEQQGMNLFFNEGRCGSCHREPEITVATVEHIVENPIGFERTIERMGMAQKPGLRLYDGGFYNTGVRPTAEDLGRGGTGPNGLPLSFTRYAKLFGEAANRVPSPPLERRLKPDDPEALDGSFKVPTLRNSELTGPYYHNGGQATLLQVVQFYTRGGDFREANIDNLAPVIGAIEILQGRPDLQRALAKFMAALTDERVRYERAPFDHPQLFVLNGHPGDHNTVTDNGSGEATDDYIVVPAIGAEGSTTPLSPFLNLPPDGVPPTSANP